MKARIRKLGVWIEETHEEAGQQISPPTRKAVAAAVIENPFAGRYVEDLSDLMDIGEELGALLGEKCVAALGIRADQAQSYGKAALVGENGELEHAVGRVRDDARRAGAERQRHPAQRTTDRDLVAGLRVERQRARLAAERA